MTGLKREGHVLLVCFTVWAYFTFAAVVGLRHIGSTEMAGMDKSNKISIIGEVADLNDHFPTTGTTMAKMGDYDSPVVNPHPKIAPPLVPPQTYFNTIEETTLLDDEHASTELGTVHDLLESTGPNLIPDYEQAGDNHGSIDHDYPPPRAHHE